MAGDELKTSTAPKPSSVKVFNCPSCGAGVTLRAAGQSVTAVCGSCDSIIDSSNENYRVIEKSYQKGKREQVIPLGQRGKLHGVLWEVIGYVERVDGSGEYSWSEYLLYNPLKGFRWLTEFDGHWNYVLTTKTKPEQDSANSLSNYGRNLAKYLGKDYFLFHKGTAKVIYVIGEFYWQVRQNETVQVEDYVSPPEILSCESSASEAIWSLGSYIDSAEIKESFQINKAMPLQSGVAPNQPSTATHAIGQVGKFWAAFVGILFVLQIGFNFLAKNQDAFSGRFEFNPADTEKTKVSPQFELKSGMANVKITLAAPVQNNWMEIQGDLVNDDNGQTYEFEQGVEYYYGHDSDGAWAEGNQQNYLILSSIPGGKYHLNLEATNGQSAAMSYDIFIKRDVTTWSNFMWALFLISIYPLFVWWRSRSFEMNRWSQSDFSPYYQHNEENE